MQLLWSGISVVALVLMRARMGVPQYPQPYVNPVTANQQYQGSPPPYSVASYPQCSNCPPYSTCCPSAYGRVMCCNPPDTVCCGDGIHCCREGYSCDIRNNVCTKNQAYTYYKPDYSGAVPGKYPVSQGQSYQGSVPDQSYSAGTAQYAPAASPSYSSATPSYPAPGQDYKATGYGYPSQPQQYEVVDYHPPNSQEGNCTHDTSDGNCTAYAFVDGNCTVSGYNQYSSSYISQGYGGKMSSTDI